MAAQEDNPEQRPADEDSDSDLRGRRRSRSSASRTRRSRPSSIRRPANVVDAALVHVRKLGDPVLRASALPWKRFRRRPAAGGAADGRADARRARGGSRGHAARRAAPRCIVYRAIPRTRLTALVTRRSRWAATSSGGRRWMSEASPAFTSRSSARARARLPARDETRSRSQDASRWSSLQDTRAVKMTASTRPAAPTARRARCTRTRRRALDLDVNAGRLRHPSSAPRARRSPTRAFGLTSAVSGSSG